MDGASEEPGAEIRLRVDRGDTMKRLAVVPATIAIAFVVLASIAPHFSAYGRVSRVFDLFGWLLLVAVIAAVATFWVATLVEVLRTGPGTQREWWLASLVVVVVLGPIGALVHKLAAPSFARDDNEALRN